MSVKDSHQIKSLQTLRDKLTAELEAKRAEKQVVDNDFNKIRQQVANVDRQIAELKALAADNSAPVVTEHALLRYLERAKGVDLEATRAEILEGRIEAIKTCGTCKIVANGVTLVVKDRAVVSVM